MRIPTLIVIILMVFGCVGVNKALCSPGCAETGSNCAWSTVPAFVTVDVVGEQFVVRVIDQSLLDEMVLICWGYAPQKVVSGWFGDEPDPGYNCGWGFYLDEDTIAISDYTIELCDGNPSMLRF